MNFGRTVLAAVAATVVFFLYGFLVQGLLIAKDYAPYPGVYRSAAAIQSHAPVGLVGTFVAILMLAIIYSKGYEGGAGAVEGARFGVLIGLFVACAFVGDNFVTLNIGHKLALEQATASLVQWTMVGITIGQVSKPATKALASVTCRV